MDTVAFLVPVSVACGAKAIVKLADADAGGGSTVAESGWETMAKDPGFAPARVIGYVPTNCNCPVPEFVAVKMTGVLPPGAVSAYT